ncbi:Putative sodium-coupled neutral amino acid transporter 11, partial [Chelonia mydas]
GLKYYFYIILTDYSIILLIKGGNLSGTNSYQELVNKSYGFIGYLILSTLQFLYPFIAMISYNIITGDTLTKVFQTIPGVGPDNLLTYRQVIILCITIIFTLPMSLYRDIAKLAKVSFISLILTTVILVIVMIRTTTLGPLVFLIYGSLEEPTLSNWSRITHVSVSLALFISVLFAVCGYVTFTGYTEGDIFENYCRDDDLATFGRFCYGVTIILTFPIECFVTREVIANVFFSGTLTTILHVAVTVIVVAVATSISLVYDCLGIVLELNCLPLHNKSLIWRILRQSCWLSAVTPLAPVPPPQYILPISFLNPNVTPSSSMCPALSVLPISCGPAATPGGQKKEYSTSLEESSYGGGNL